MKKTFKLIVIAAIAAIIGFSVAGCSDGAGGDTTPEMVAILPTLQLPTAHPTPPALPLPLAVPLRD